MKKSVAFSSQVTQGSSAVLKSVDLSKALALVGNGAKLEKSPHKTLGTEARLALFADLQRLGERVLDRLVGKARRHDDPIQAVEAILREASIFRSRVGFGDPDAMGAMRENLRSLVRQQAPISLALPVGGGKVANPLKVGDVFHPDVSDMMQWLSLANLVRAIEEVYSPGAHVYVIPDAELHTADLGFSAAETSSYRRQMLSDLEDLGVKGEVTVVDTIEELPSGWAPWVMERAQWSRREEARDPSYASGLLPQVESLMTSSNLRGLGFDYEHLVRFHGALREGDQASDLAPEALSHRKRISSIVHHYVAINHALREFDLPRRVVEKHTGRSEFIRLTVHAKPGEPRPLLTFQGERTRPTLIPMHGVALRYRSKKGKDRFAIVFDLEARVNGWTPVHDSGGRFLYYEQGDARAETGAELLQAA